MSLIAIAGPHAIGKTTAVYRWMTLYPKLFAIIADDQWEAETVNGKIERVRVREWKGTTEEKGQLVNALRKRNKVSIIDSVRTTCINYFKPGDHVIFVTCSGETMERVLQARCKRNNKKYNATYWDMRKLTYESRVRYVNAAAKFLTPDQAHWFTIEDQARDWPAVDEYFGKLYRKLHNDLVRRK